jgi:pimeloyl-ACP methyl ester carboxylesterase
MRSPSPGSLSWRDSASRRGPLSAALRIPGERDYNSTSTQTDTEAEMSAAREDLPGVRIAPRALETVAGKVEFDLTEGEGPVVLASHGGIGGVDQARLMLGWLDPADYRLLSVSRPGYLNTPLASGRSIEEQADLFAALLDALGVERAATVAFSSGGPPGYMFAARHPGRVSALVAIDSVSGYHEMPKTAGPIAQVIFMSRWGQKFMEMLVQKKPAWFLRQLFQGTAYFTKQQIQAHIDFALGSPKALAFIRGFMATMNPYNPRKAGTDNDAALYRRLTHSPVEQVRCPTLVVHGTHDADVMFHHGVYAHENIPGAERFWIEEGSHLGFWLSPRAARAQDAAREFLSRHRP